MSDQKKSPTENSDKDVTRTVKKKTAAKKSNAPKKVAAKKAGVKKTAPAKKSPPKKSPANKSSATTEHAATIETDQNPVALNTIIEQMNKDRASRDKHIASLIEEVRTGFDTLSRHSTAQDEHHAEDLTTLYHSLQKTFGSLNESNEQRDEKNLSMFRSLSDSIMKDHEQTLKEVHEQEKLQDKKLRYIDKKQNQRIGINRLIAVPAVIIAVIGIVYMFNIVTIMEAAMTSMSKDMSKIEQSVSKLSTEVSVISQDTSAMSRNTTTMNNNMQALNTNTEQMSKDLNVMTHNVVPAMRGMRSAMPWSP